MQNPKMIDGCVKLVTDSMEYWDNLCNEYNISNVPFLIYGNDYTGEYLDDVNSIRNVTGKMITSSSIYGINNPDINPDDRIIEYVRSIVMMSYEELYGTIIDCELDFDEAFESMKLWLRHELGHVIEKQKFIGKTMSEWNQHLAENPSSDTLMPRLDRDASLEDTLKWFLEYHRIPVEKAADDAVGITEEDIIEDFNRLS